MFGLPKKQRIFHETVKDRHTSHWDLDLLSHEELAAAMGAPTHGGTYDGAHGVESRVTCKGAEKGRKKS